MTSPPKERTSPTIVTPTCPCGIAAANSATDNPTAHSTEIPVMLLGWVPVLRLISSGRLRPPRTTKASFGILSTSVGCLIQVRATLYQKSLLIAIALSFDGAIAPLQASLIHVIVEDTIALYV